MTVMTAEQGAVAFLPALESGLRRVVEDLS
ncbi:MAG: hypothetical protein QOD30_308 [Actinomycetota bacterium]|jgi:hypothetical protein|nr:hypothetical protein [Actinomycetota bacterium]